LCGEIDQAADWLERCIEQRDGLAPSNRWYFEACSSPRWPALAKMMNLPETKGAPAKQRARFAAERGSANE